MASRQENKKRIDHVYPLGTRHKSSNWCLSSADRQRQKVERVVVEYYLTQMPILSFHVLQAASSLTVFHVKKKEPESERTLLCSRAYILSPEQVLVYV